MKTAILIIIMFLSASFTHAQVGIGTTTPSNNAALDVTSNNKGLLLPRLSDTSIVTNPSAGLLIYNMNTKSPAFHNGTNWNSIASSTNTSTTAATGNDSVTYTIATAAGTFTAGTFKIFAASHGVASSGGPAANFQDISFTKPMDINSTAFAKAVAGGTTLPTIEIKFYTRGATTPYFSLKGTTVKISSYQVSARTADGAFAEQVSFSAIIYGYKDWVNNISFGWNTNTNASTTY